MFRFIYMILETIIQLKWMFKSLLQHYTIVSGSILAIVVIMLTFTGSEAEHTTLHLWTGGRSLCDVRILRNQRVCLDKIRRGDGHLALKRWANLASIKQIDQTIRMVIRLTSNLTATEKYYHIPWILNQLYCYPRLIGRAMDTFCKDFGRNWSR